MAKSKFDVSLDSFIGELKKNKKKRENMSKILSTIIFDEFRSNPHVSPLTKSEEASERFIEYFLTNKI